ncbi:MAG: cupin domain-containing protein [Armatimonadetes bacterium]|nr:cupin domain-containing protein [Armatimonadota bacterium]
MSQDRTVSPDVIPHAQLVDAKLGGVPEGKGSKVFHLDDLPELSSEHDRRHKRVIINRALVDTVELLVDTLRYEPGGTSPLHYHRGTEHFFIIQGGRGKILIGEREYTLTPGTVVWIADGDVHKVYADDDSELVFLEFFSRGDHETVFLEEAGVWRLEEASSPPG